MEKILGLIIIIMIIWIYCRGGLEYLLSGPRTLVYYTNPGCGYCKQFDPTWEKLKKSGNNRGMRINFKKINCKDRKNNMSCQIAKDEYGMQGTPFIALMQGGKVKKFNDNRNLSTLLKFVESDI